MTAEEQSSREPTPEEQSSRESTPEEQSFLDATPDEPALDPAGSGPSTFAAIGTQEGLLAWSAAYCERAVGIYDLAVDLSLVDWSVSTRAKRRAAAVKRPRLREAAVGEPVDWTAVEAAGRRADGRPARCTMVLTWAAFEAFDRSTWTAVLRHELVHVEQFQAFGTTDHGPAFRRRAAAVDAGRSCPAFAVPKYRLLCGRCGAVVARRYRDCELVRAHDSYRSSCCRARLDCERPDAG